MKIIEKIKSILYNLIGDKMYIVLAIIATLFIIVTIIYFKDKNKIVKELNKIEKENGTANKKKKK